MELKAAVEVEAAGNEFRFAFFFVTMAAGVEGAFLGERKGITSNSERTGEISTGASFEVEATGALVVAIDVAAVTMARVEAIARILAFSFDPSRCLLFLVSLLGETFVVVVVDVVVAKAEGEDSSRGRFFVVVVVGCFRGK